MYGGPRFCNAILDLLMFPSGDPSPACECLCSPLRCPGILQKRSVQVRDEKQAALQAKMAGKKDEHAERLATERAAVRERERVEAEMVGVLEEMEADEQANREAAAEGESRLTSWHSPMQRQQHIPCNNNGGANSWTLSSINPIACLGDD